MARRKLNDPAGEPCEQEQTPSPVNEGPMYSIFAFYLRGDTMRYSPLCRLSLALAFAMYALIVRAQKPAMPPPGGTDQAGKPAPSAKPPSPKPGALKPYTDVITVEAKSEA